MKKIIYSISSILLTIYTILLIWICSFGVHVFTAYTAYISYGIFFGIIAFLSPIISTVIMAILYTIFYGIINPFNVVILIYILLYIPYLLLVFITTKLEDK